ncbi:MAG: crossover junction endodeoxyribonuclease RuvC [Parcubacteria group bacterium]
MQISKSAVTILGIDPGIASTGYGVVKKVGKTVMCVEYGVITTKPVESAPRRLKKIFSGVNRLVRAYHPQVAAVEQIFFAKNVKTAFAVGQARGVILLALGSTIKTIAEYSPLQVKQTMVGYGKADKRQVQKMVRLHLSMKELPSPDDAADALAVALCWAFDTQQHL